MSSHLNSFHFDDSFSRPNSSVTRSKIQRSDEDDSSNDEIDFDDTNLETPKALRERDNSTMTKNIDASNVSSGSTRRSFFVRNTTVKVPLKGDGNGRHSVSTPMSKQYKARNGTPLRQPPITSDTVFEEEFEATFSKVDNNDDLGAESNLIKNSKIISDDNKFSPQAKSGHSPRKTPIKGKRYDIQPDEIISPPPNFKLTPLDFSNLSGNSARKQKDGQGHRRQEEKSSEVAEEKEIEFDPSEDEGEANAHHVDTKGSRTSISGSPVGRDSVKRSYVQNSPSVFNIDSRPKSPAFVPERAGVSESSPSPSPSPSPPLDPADISRADILDRINATIQSIKEREMAEIPSKSPSRRTSGSPGILNGHEYGEVEGPDDMNESIDHDMDDNDDILHELDSFLHPPTAVAPSNLNEAVPNILPSSSEGSASTSDSTDWPTSKWLKLYKIIRMRKLSNFDIIDSSIIQNSLETTRNDLAKRVHFLVEFDKHNQRARERAKSLHKKTRNSKKSTKAGSSSINGKSSGTTRRKRFLL